MNPEEEYIYCIMVTGKNDDRLKYARKACINFVNQTFNKKVLLVFNHNNKILNLHDEFKSENIIEYQFDNKIYNLGEIKNIALDMIPESSLWTIWDDDDYRSLDFLTTLYNTLKIENAFACTITRRVDYNIITKFGYEATKQDGFVTILSRNKKNIRYLEKTTMEDLSLIKDIQKNGRLVLIKNHPLLYIRLIHSSNTSLYVKSNKNNIVKYNGVYKEYLIDEYMMKNVETIIKENLDININNDQLE